MNYQITPDQENELATFEKQGGSIYDLVAELGTMSVRQNDGEYHERLYSLIWNSVLKLLFPLLRGNFEIPWRALGTMEDSWDTKPPNLAAFHALEQSLNKTPFMPCRFIRSPRQNIIAKLVVSSAIWFEKNIGKERIKHSRFEIATDDLVAQLAEYDHYFCQRKSCTVAIERLHSLHKQSRNSVFDQVFISGQINYSLVCHQRRIEEEEQERERQLQENRRREEEERRELELRTKLSEEGRRGIRGWYVGTVERCIIQAQEYGYLDILRDWSQYALDIKCENRDNQRERRDIINALLQDSIDGLQIATDRMRGGGFVSKAASELSDIIQTVWSSPLIETAFSNDSSECFENFTNNDYPFHYL